MLMEVEKSFYLGTKLAKIINLKTLYEPENYIKINTLTWLNAGREGWFGK